MSNKEDYWRQRLDVAAWADELKQDAAKLLGAPYALWRLTDLHALACQHTGAEDISLHVLAAILKARGFHRSDYGARTETDGQVRIWCVRGELPDGADIAKLYDEERGQ